MITPFLWKSICYSILVLLLPYLFTGFIDGRSWVTIAFWVVGLCVIWFRPRRTSS